MATGQARGQNFFLYSCFYLATHRGGLLNLAKPAQNLYFFDDFFAKFQRICDRIFFIIIFNLSHFFEISQKKKKRWPG